MSSRDLCLRCGLCCYEKIHLDDGRILITDIPCEHLDPATNLCRIYADRHARNRRCLPAEEAKALGMLPAHCPYVAGDPDYEPPLLLSEHPAYREEVHRLFAEERRERSAASDDDPVGETG